MHRTTISIDEPDFAELHRIADERQISVAAVIREAIEEKIGRAPGRSGARNDSSPSETSARRREQGPRATPPMPRVAAAGASGYTDTSVTVATERIPPRSWR